MNIKEFVHNTAYLVQLHYIAGLSHENSPINMNQSSCNMYSVYVKKPHFT